jgi:hypothetical protein
VDWLYLTIRGVNPFPGSKRIESMISSRLATDRSLVS